MFQDTLSIFNFRYHVNFDCGLPLDGLSDLAPFAQIKWRSFTFSKIALSKIAGFSKYNHS